jgi:two-component system, LytTR family, response regulator
MQKLSCIIVEDEPLARERVEDYTRQIPFLECMASFDNALDALAFLNTKSVDLLFLDINLGAFSGIQMLESAAIQSQVILTTAHHEYALKGYELKVCDYLLKPYTFERFVQAVSRAQQLLGKSIVRSLPQYIFVKTEYRLEKIMVDEILYIEGMGDYRRIHTPSKRIMTLQSFAEFEKDLAPEILLRVHKSYMVAIPKIEAVEKDRIKIQDALIPISDTYREAFYARIR